MEGLPETKEDVLCDCNVYGRNQALLSRQSESLYLDLQSRFTRQGEYNGNNFHSRETRF
jgi:hypothetical protein